MYQRAGIAPVHRRPRIYKLDATLTLYSLPITALPMKRLFDGALTALVLFHLLLAPYTKVEESFNMQAVHDMLNYGVYPSLVLANYDHTTFPGAVPRTFVGSAVLALVVRLADFFYGLVFGQSFVADGRLGQLHVQLVVRGVLGVFNILGFFSLRNALVKITPRKRSKSGSVKPVLASLAFTFLLLGQFHVMFYASRALPNFLVLPLVNFALAKLVEGDVSGLTWLAMCGAVFRIEVGVFATIIALTSSLVFGASNVFQNAFLLAVGAIVGSVLSYTIDSHFWQTHSVPEVQSFLFNVVSGNASKWGVEPFGAYFSKYIPAFFRPPHVLFLAIFGFIYDPVADSARASRVQENDKQVPAYVGHPAQNSLRILLVSSILFVLTMSLQPHKEWRFIVYIVPVLTLLAGNGLSSVWAKQSKLIAYKLVMWLMVGSGCISLALSLFMSYASSYNYPGGFAMNYFLENLPNGNLTVHMDVPACMTGITKFTELHQPRVTFDKTEHPDALLQKWNSFDYLITHVDMSLTSDELYNLHDWEKITAVPSFAGVNVIGGVRSLNEIVRDEKARNNLFATAWADLKRGRFSTLESFCSNSLYLRDALFIYKRVGHTDLGLAKSLIEELDRTDYIPDVEDLDPLELKNSINQQIDQLEDEL